MAYDGTLTLDTALNASDFKERVDGLDKGLGALGNGLDAFKLIEKGFNAITSSMDDAISRYDALNNFPKVLERMGFEADASAAATQKLSDGVQGLPTSIDSIVSTAQQIAVLTGNLGNSVDTTLALNNAFVASGASGDEAARGLDQYIKMLSSGQVDSERFKTLHETMGFALQRTAEAFGFAGESAQNDLFAALKNGNISFDQFNAKLIELNNGVGGFAELAQTSSGGISTAWTNLQTAMVRGTTEIVQSIDNGLSKTRFGSIENVINGMKDGVYKALATMGKAFELLAASAEVLIPILLTIGAAVLAWKIGAILTPIIQGFQTAAMQVALYAAEIKVAGATDAIHNATLTGKEIIMGLLTGKIKFAAAAQHIWNAAMAANPIGTVVAIIAVAVLAIAALAAALHRGSAAYQAQKAEIDALTASMDEHIAAMDEAIAEGDKVVAETTAQAQAAQQLIERMTRLTAIERKTAEQKEGLAQIVAQLAKEYPALNLEYDKEADKLNMLQGQIIRYVDAKNRIAKTTALQEKAIKTQTALNQLEADQAVLLEQIKILEADGSIGILEKINLGKELSKQYQDNAKAIKEHQRTVDAAAKATENANTKEERAIVNTTEALQAKTENGGSQLNRYAHQYGMTTDEILAQLAEMDMTHDEWAEHMAKSLTESGMNVEMLGKKWGMTAEEVEKCCQDWGINYDEFNEHMKTIHTEAGEDIDALAAKWGVSTQQIREWIAINESDVQGWADMMAEQWENYEETVKERVDGVVNSFEEIPDKFDKSAEEMLETLIINKERYAEWEITMAEITRQLGPTAAEEFGKLGPAATSAMQEILGSTEMLNDYRNVFGVKIDEATGAVIERYNDPAFIGAPAAALNAQAKLIEENTALPQATGRQLKLYNDILQSTIANADINAPSAALDTAAQKVTENTALNAAAEQQGKQYAATLQNAVEGVDFTSITTGVAQAISSGAVEAAAESVSVAVQGIFAKMGAAMALAAYDAMMNVAQIITARAPMVRQVTAALAQGAVGSLAIMVMGAISAANQMMDGMLLIMSQKANALYKKARDIAANIARALNGALDAPRVPAGGANQGADTPTYTPASLPVSAAALSLALEPEKLTSLTDGLRAMAEANPLRGFSAPAAAYAGGAGSVYYSTSLTQNITSPEPLSPAQMTREGLDMLKRSQWLLP